MQKGVAMKRLRFFPRFADQVASGQITRALHGRLVLPGDQFELRCGQRLLGHGRITMAREVSIQYKRYFAVIKVDGVSLCVKDMETFARQLGFPELDALIDFLSDFEVLPFLGKVVTWELVREAVSA
jgi:hypothetical protein